MDLRGILLTAVLMVTSTAAFAATPVTKVVGTVGDVTFPDKAKAHLASGDFVNAENLRQMRTGLGKAQVRLLLGDPHFGAGLFGVKTWDYVFNFHTGNGDEFITCQYQVDYDKRDGRYVVASLHWDSPTCMDELNREEPASVPPPVEKPAEQHFSLSADALFRFGGYGLADLLPGGRASIEAVAKQLAGLQDATVKVIGHTDRIGSEEANQQLSERRAETVRDVLVDSGVSAPIETEGAGEKMPVKTCTDTSRQALIACLAPNRRVELVVEGTH